MLLTVNVDGTVRSSSASSTIRTRWDDLRIVRCPVRKEGKGRERPCQRCHSVLSHMKKLPFSNGEPRDLRANVDRIRGSRDSWMPARTALSRASLFHLDRAAISFVLVPTQRACERITIFLRLGQTFGHERFAILVAASLHPRPRGLGSLPKPSLPPSPASNRPLNPPPPSATPPHAADCAPTPATTTPPTPSTDPAHPPDTNHVAVPAR